MKQLRSRQGSRRSILPRRALFEQLEARQVLSAPSLAAIADVELISGSPLYIPLDAFDADSDTLTFTATSNNANITTYIPEGNRSMRISALSDDGAINGDMVFELFEDRVSDVTDRIIQLAESGFYDGIIFHRVINDFMIQTGDPTGTGSGSSELPDFDDHFDVDLQHNTTGILSMAKSLDDTNNSQFFITEGAQRHLDFNHSIFGLLVEGEDIREAISEADTGTDTKPDVNIVMESVEIFVDNQNGVLMLKVPDLTYTSGDADITVTVNDGHGGQDQVTFHVTVSSDAVDNDPFLDKVPEIRTTVDTPVEFQLTAIDAEGDDAYYLDQWTIYQNQMQYPYVVYDNPYTSPTPDELRLPLVCHTDLDYAVTLQDSEDPVATGGQVVVTPSNGLVGIHPITVASLAKKDYVDFTAMDYQLIPVFIVPDEAPTAELDMTLVRDLTDLGEYGEIDALPEDQWIDEWDSFTIEVWATVTEDGAFGVHTVSTDLTFDNSLFTATAIEYGPAFTENQSGDIQNTTGTVVGLGGTTNVFSTDYHSGLYYVDEDGNYLGADYGWAPDDVGLYGDGQPVLVARVSFEPNTDGPGVPNNAVDGYLTAETELGFAFDNAQILWSSQDATALTTHDLANAELWPVMYDLDDDGEIGLGDLSYFAAAYHHTVGDAGIDYTWASDFNRNGEVGLGDLSYFASVYGIDVNSPGELNYPNDFPDAWRETTESAALMGTVLSGDEGDETSGDTEASGDSDNQLDEAALASAASSSLKSSTTQRRQLKIAAVDLALQLYDQS